LRSPPRESRDLVTAARLSYVLAYDNISTLPQWLSDALSMIATGGGYEARALYTDLDEVLVRFRRPIIINGIEGPARNADLVDRSILLTLASIDDSTRRTEAEIETLLEELAGELVGAVFTAISAAQRNRDTTPAARWARMVDASTWAIAAADALGTDPLTLETALRSNRVTKDDLVIEGSAVAQAILEFAISHAPWEGTTSELKSALEEETPSGLAHAGRRGWPANASAFGSQIARELPALRRKGVSWNELGRTGSARRKQLTFASEVSDDKNESSMRKPSSTSPVSLDVPKGWDGGHRSDHDDAAARHARPTADDARHGLVTPSDARRHEEPPAPNPTVTPSGDAGDAQVPRATRSPDLIAFERAVAAVIRNGQARLHALDGTDNPFPSPISAPRLGYITTHGTIVVLKEAASRILQDHLDGPILGTALSHAKSLAVGERTVDALELPLLGFATDSPPRDESRRTEPTNPEPFPSSSHHGD
jgi:hypothetical protein